MSLTFRDITTRVLATGLLSLPLSFYSLFYISDAAAVDASNTAINMIQAKEADIDIKIDGKLDEAIWQTLPAKDDMVLIEPDTLTDAPLETRTYFFYTEKGLYVGVFAEQAPDTLVARLSSRDSFITRDNISLTLDPSGEGLYGYWFGVNLGGTLQDGTVIPERQFSSQWDGAWYGASAVQDDGWTAEMFIPWSLMSMPDGGGEAVRKMGYYISRFVAHKNERWAFPGLPPTKSVFLSQLQPVNFKGVNPKQQFTFYPYASTTYNKIATDHKDAYKTGFDLFWRPSSNLQVSATINPDFGNVESDNVVVNLSAFETFFSEKRAFFLEGQEIFNTTPRARSRRGTPTTLVNTRRIGSRPLLPDNDDFELDAVERNQPSELAAAVKVTGQYSNLRYGILMASEDDTKLRGEINNTAIEILQTGRDFGIARLLYEDTSSGARRSIGWLATQVNHEQGDATVNGIDGHYLSKSGKWNTDAQLMFSDVDGINGQGGFVDIAYSPQRGRKHKLGLDYLDEDLDINDLGFLRRNDQVGFKYNYIRQDSGMDNLKSLETKFDIVQSYNIDGRLVRSGLFASQNRNFNNNQSLSLRLNYFPARWDDRLSGGNGDYRIDGRWNSSVFYKTDSSKTISLESGIFYTGGDLGGRTIEYEVNLSWRPSDRFSLQLALEYEDYNGWLLHNEDEKFTTFNAEFWRPEIEMDLFLSAKQQFRLTLQWAGIKAFEKQRLLVPGDGDRLIADNTAVTDSRDFSISRLTFQARYKWELAPLSDLFVVYTRGSNLDSMPDSGFGDLLRDAATDTLVDIFVIKLRYRLGS